MAKQTVGIGTSANDGTGDPLRTAMDKINDNFNELYVRQGPVSGSGSEAVVSAVKYFEVNEKQPGQLFCIDLMKTGTVNGSDFDYEISIAMVTALAGSPEQVMTYTATVGSLKTGKELIALAEYDGSGFFGNIVVDWSLLTSGQTIQLADWEDGALFVNNVTSGRFNTSENSIQVIAQGDDTQILDGSKRLYSIPDPADDQIVTLCPSADAVGDVVIVIGSLKNTINSFYIYADDPEEIEGVSAAIITITDGKPQTVTLVPLKDSGGWAVGNIAGEFTITSNT